MQFYLPVYFEIESNLRFFQMRLGFEENLHLQWRRANSRALDALNVRDTFNTYGYCKLKIVVKLKYASDIMDSGSQYEKGKSSSSSKRVRYIDLMQQIRKRHEFIFLIVRDLYEKNRSYSQEIVNTNKNKEFPYNLNHGFSFLLISYTKLFATRGPK